jgi:serine/threonine protein kinase
VQLELGFASLPRSHKELFEAVEDLLKGLKRLHSKKLAHRDLRWENVVQLRERVGSSRRSSWCLVDLETVWAADQVSRGHSV